MSWRHHQLLNSPPWQQWKRRGKGGITSMKRHTDEPVKIRYSQYLGKSYDLAFKFGNGK